MDKEDLILKLLGEFKTDVNRQFEEFKTDVNRRFEQMEEARKEDRAENARRFEQIDKRFEQIDKRFEQVDKHFEQVIDLIREEKQERKKMEEKLEKVYETRHEVEYKITRDFIIKNIGWNLGVIAIGLILGKLMFFV